MSDPFLATVIAKTRDRISSVKKSRYEKALRLKAESIRKSRAASSLRYALTGSRGINIIAEIKRASPSRGQLNVNVEPATLARHYVAGGASAISVLTEPEYFLGSVGDLIKVRAAVTGPILRKDFIVDEFQILEAAAAGADAVLLIVAALTNEELARFIARSEELGLDALVEVHTESELARAHSAGAKIIGVNNRDLRSLKISLDVSRQLAARKPDGAMLVSESGISSRSEIDELRALGFDAFLIGEALMRAGDPAALLKELGA